MDKCNGLKNRKIFDLIFNNDKKYSVLDFYSYGVAFAFLGFSIAVFFININIDWHKDWVDVAKVITSFLILASIVMAIINYRYIKKWNQQKAAVEALHNSKKLLKSSIRLLDKELDIQEKLIHNEILTIQELHNIIGVFLYDGEFVFHGEEKYEDKLKIHKKSNGFTQRFCGIKGREIYEAIEDVLNEYEYLCMAANQEIFYKKTLIELRGSGIVRIFNLFSNHIYHLRCDERHGFGPRLYSHLEKFANDVGIELGLEVNMPSEKDYLSTFDKKTQPIK